MVGVAGRSKGCGTCRQRRLGCDLERPQCRRCRRSGRQCEGYERFPVFISQDGSNRYQREAPLEKPDLDSQQYAILNTDNFQSPAAWDQRLASALLDVYAPPTRKYWLYGAVSVLESSETLRLSVRALSLSRLAFNAKDPALVIHGLEAYGKALRCVRREIKYAGAQFEDGTLIAVRVLSLFEAFNEQETPRRGWNSHENGVVALLSLREIPSSGLAKSIYREARYSSVTILTSFLTMSAPPLEPDPSVAADDREELLWNLAFELSRLNSRVRTASNTSAILESDVETAMLLHECVLLDHRCQEWEDTVRKQTLPFTIDPASAISTSTYESGYTFDSDNTGYTFSYYWGFRTLLCNVALYLIQQLPFATGLLYTDPNLSAFQASPSSMRSRFEAARHSYAVHIIRGSHFALSPTSGHYGAYRISFGVLVAFFAFQQSGDLTGAQAAAEAIRRLADEKGLSFAKKALGKYATPGSETVKGCSSGRAA